MRHFFFYGSLRTGYWNQRILSKDVVRVGLARTYDPFKLYIGKYGTVPTCCPVENGVGGVPLVGDLYLLNPSDARSVFSLEMGYDNEAFEVVLEDGSVVEAIIFHHEEPDECPYLDGHFDLVANGDYTTVISPNGKRI